MKSLRLNLEFQHVEDLGSMILHLEIIRWPAIIFPVASKGNESNYILRIRYYFLILFGEFAA